MFSKPSAHGVAVWLAYPTAHIWLWLTPLNMLCIFPIHPLTLFGKQSDPTDPRCSCVCFHAMYERRGRASYWSKETLPKHLLIGKARSPNNWWSMYRMRQTASWLYWMFLFQQQQTSSGLAEQCLQLSSQHWPFPAVLVSPWSDCNLMLPTVTLGEADPSAGVWKLLDWTPWHPATDSAISGWHILDMQVASALWGR